MPAREPLSIGTATRSCLGYECDWEPGDPAARGISFSNIYGTNLVYAITMAEVAVGRPPFDARAFRVSRTVGLKLDTDQHRMLVAGSAYEVNTSTKEKGVIYQNDGI